MELEHSVWNMQGLSRGHPDGIQSWWELINWINEIGFLPLFRNEVPGFSVEEHTAAAGWWTGDEERDPWQWRQIIARSGQVAYGKFFGRKAGFVSKAWFPHFANGRRDGYDFDSRWDEGLAGIRQKRIMDQFEQKDQLFSFQLKQLAGFGKGGEKNFEGTVTDLQMQCYLLIRDFRQRTNRQGLPYGWPISVYATPETLWGYAHITSAYSVDPNESKALIRQQLEKCFPEVREAQWKAVLG